VSITQEAKPEGLAADVLEEGWNTVGLVASGEAKKIEVTSKKKNTKNLAGTPSASSHQARGKKLQAQSH
jgi:hypothetical protein